MCVSNVPSESKADRDEPRSADERSESAGVGPKTPGGRAKRGRRRRTERLLRTEPHWSFSTPLILNDQIRSNGVRSSDLIVSVRPVHPDRKPIATNPDRRPSEARLPASDRKAVTNRTALVVQYAFDPATTSSVVYGVYGGTE